MALFVCHTGENSKLIILRCITARLLVCRRPDKFTLKIKTMKKIFTTFLSLFVVVGAWAQSADTTYWRTEGVFSVNMSQVSFSNWSAGGDGSVAFDLGFNYSADYARDKTLLQERIELAYGLNNTSSKGTRKTNDKIFLSSLYGHKIAPKWYLSILMTFNTQFAKGYDYDTDPKTKLSSFMAPAYFSLGAGFTWTPKSWFSATFSPATWRETFVRDSELSAAGNFGVDPGKHHLTSFGANVRGEVTYEFLPNMTVYSRLDLFSDYLHKPQNVDVNWNTQITMKINKWFAANLNFTMVYDDDIKIAQSDGTSGPRLQIKEVLGIGIQARF